jgi:hypothetical protein
MYIVFAAWDKKKYLGIRIGIEITEGVILSFP